MAYKRKTITATFCHDLEDGWYYARFPDSTHDGNYGCHKSIEKIAVKHGWKIRWVGNQMYNPWKKIK